MPDLEPETVAEEIVKKVLSGTSGQVLIPGVAGFIAGLRWFPNWLQLHFRTDASRLMNNWKGRQVCSCCCLKVAKPC